MQPSAPAGPTSPSRMTSAPAPQQPGGFMSRWGGMLGGLALGGLLGSLLFGGMGGGLGGGMGLMEIALLAGLAFLAFQFFRRRQPQPAPAGAAAYGSTGWAPAESTAREGVSVATPAAPVDDDLERGLAAIRMMDPAFDLARFTAIATDLFQRLQIGWNAQDLGSVRANLTDEMAVALDRDLSRLREQHRANRVDKVTVESAEVTEAWQEYGRDLVTVRLRASALDYTIDQTTGALVEGSQTVPTSFQEFWTLARPVGPNAWKLSAIQQPQA